MGRSGSLSRIEQEYPGQDAPQAPQSRKRKDPPSPKGKISVQETKAKFELQEKYRNRRNLKDINKEKNKFKRNCKKTTVETVEDPIAKMLKDMMTDLKEIKNDVKGNNSKIDQLTDNVNAIENEAKVNEEKNANKVEELKDEIGKIEERVTTKLMTEMEPSINGMKNEIQSAINVDLRRLVQEELALQQMRNSKELEEATSETEGEEKNNKLKKN